MHPFRQLLLNSGFHNLQGDQFVMVLIGLVLILLAVSRRHDSLLLVALGFGIVVGNMPFSPVETVRLIQEGRTSVFTVLHSVVGSELLPTLLFLGIGAMTDFSMLIANPRLVILGGGAQIGIFAAALLAGRFFAPENAAVAAIVGGAHAPLAIYAASALNPEMIGAAAIAAYICTRAVPLIVTPVVKLLTTPAERRIRVEAPREVSRKMRILFPVIGFIVCIAFVPAVRGVLGMLFLGNLLRESGTTGRISRTVGRTFTDIVIVLLAFGVGWCTTAEAFLRVATLGVLVCGLLSCVLAVGWGILMAKVMNVFLRRKINPLLGAASVSVAPVAARAVHRMALEEDPENHLLRQAMVPNLAAMIALAVTIGVFITLFTPLS